MEKPIIFLDKEELNTLYKLKIPKNGEKVTLLDYNGNEYEKEIKEAGSMEKARVLEKNGFRLEETKVGAIVKSGKAMDVRVYGLAFG